MGSTSNEPNCTHAKKTTIKVKERQNSEDDPTRFRGSSRKLSNGSMMERVSNQEDAEGPRRGDAVQVEIGESKNVGGEKKKTKEE